MIIDGKEFKSYDNFYYVSADGDVWSEYSHKCLKHNIDVDGYHRVDIHGRHLKIHRLVYLTWVGKIPNGMQINHLDDNKDNNNYQNLYLGTQKENIQDCQDNQHRIGNTKKLTVLDKELNQVMIFQPANLFLTYSGHPSANQGVSRALTRNWFKERFVLISYEKGVTTKSKATKGE